MTCVGSSTVSREIHFRIGRDKMACLPGGSLPSRRSEPQSSRRSSEKGPGAVVEAVVPTAYLSTGPWYKGPYNLPRFHTLILCCT